MSSCNGGIPSVSIGCLTFRQLQLGSDIQIYLTRTGLSPSPVRYAFLTYLTVFVKVFHVLIYYSKKAPE